MSASTTRDERQEEYEKLLRIIEYNTGGEQPALATRSAIFATAKHAGMSTDTAKRRLQAAIENGDVVTIRDRVVRATEEKLQEALGELNGDVARLAGAIEEVQGDG